MSFVDAFRSFLGFPARRPDLDGRDDSEWRRGVWSRNDFDDDIFAFEREMKNIFDKFDSVFSDVFKSFDSEFHNFGSNFGGHFADDQWRVPSYQLPANPRDLMLKEGEERDVLWKKESPNTGDKKSDLSDESSVRRLLGKEKGDCDFDAAVDRHGLDQLWSLERRRGGETVESTTDNWWKEPSVTMRSYVYKSRVSGDGRVEEQRVVRDGRGNEETTVIQKIGDQTYSQTVKKNERGEVEERRDLVNLDEQQLDEFKSRWSRWW